MAQPVGAIQTAVQGVALQAAAGIPMGGGAVALRVGIVAAIVILLESHDHAVAGERPQTAHVGVVGCAHHGEVAVVGILIPIDPLPVPARVLIERVLNPHRRTQSQHLQVEDPGECPDAGPACQSQKGATGNCHITCS